MSTFSLNLPAWMVIVPLASVSVTPSGLQVSGVQLVKADDLLGGSGNAHEAGGNQLQVRQRALARPAEFLDVGRVIHRVLDHRAGRVGHRVLLVDRVKAHVAIALAGD